MRTGTLLLALFLILAGMVIFLVNLGYVSPVFSQQLLRLWPLALVIIGLGLFWGGLIPRPLAFTLVAVLVLGVAAVAFIFPYSGPRGAIRSDLLIERDRYPGLEKGHLSFRFGGGRFSLDAQTAHWFEGDFHGRGRTSPSYSIHGEKLNVTIKEELVAWPARRHMLNGWRMHLSPDLRWDLDVESGAVDGTLNLESLPLQNVRLKFGAGNMTVRLGDNGTAARLRVEAGAANLKIQVREDTGLSIGMEGVLANNNLRDLGWVQAGGRYCSPAYEKGVSQVDMDIEMAVGNLTVEVLPVQR